MIKKETIVLTISVIIIAIAVGITLQGQISANQAKKQIAEFSAALKQKDTQIANLTEEIKAAQDELVSIKAELDTAKKTLADIATKANAAAQQPVVQQPVADEQPTPVETPQAVTQ